MSVKTVTVENLVEKFSLKVLAGQNHLHRTITQPQAHRPGLEFVGFFEYFPMERVQVLGRKEITYLHQLSEDWQYRQLSSALLYCYFRAGRFRLPEQILYGGRNSIAEYTRGCL